MPWGPQFTVVISVTAPFPNSTVFRFPRLGLSSVFEFEKPLSPDPLRWLHITPDSRSQRYSEPAHPRGQSSQFMGPGAHTAGRVTGKLVRSCMASLLHVPRRDRDDSETLCPAHGWTARTTAFTPYQPSGGSTGRAGVHGLWGRLSCRDLGWTGTCLSSEVSQGSLNSMTWLLAGQNGQETHLGTVSSHILAGASTICLCGGSHYLSLPCQLTNGMLEAAVNGV